MKASLLSLEKSFGSPLKTQIGRSVRGWFWASSILACVASLVTPAFAVTPLVINVQDFGALGSGTASDRASIQSAIDMAATSGQPSVVQFPYTTHSYLIDSTLSIRSNISIDGQNSVLTYTGTGAAIDAALTGSVTYPVNVKISNLLINLMTSGTTTQPVVGVNFRFSHSRMDNVSVALLASYQTAFVFPGDYYGTGPYYNAITKCNVSGHRNLTGWSVSNQNGIVFTHSASATSHGPNANTFIGGRVSAVDTAWHIEGLGNSIYSPTCEGTVTTVFDVNNPDSAINCQDNSIEGGYVEQSATAAVYMIGSGAMRTYIRSGHITSVGPTIFSDGGTDSCIIAPGFKQNLPLYPNPQVGLNLFQANNTQIFVFYGTPEGHVVAGMGSLCLNLNGGGATLYVKQSRTDSFGWVAK